MNQYNVYNMLNLFFSCYHDDKTINVDLIALYQKPLFPIKIMLKIDQSSIKPR